MSEPEREAAVRESAPTLLRDVIAQDPRLAELLEQARAHAALEALHKPKPWWRRYWERLCAAWRATS